MTTDDKPAPEAGIVRAVIDADTCPTCRAADGSKTLLQWPLLDHCTKVAGGTGTCRCYVEPVATVVSRMRAALIDALTPELGPRMARAAVLGPDPPLSPEDAETYDAVQLPINIRHVSLNADGTFTLAYEKGERYEVPQEQSFEADVSEVVIDREALRGLTNTHPAPWRWSENDPGLGLSMLDAEGRFIFAVDLGEGIPSVVERAFIAAAPEMEALLRRALYETQPNGVCGDIHETDDWREQMKTLLARIDAAADAGKR